MILNFNASYFVPRSASINSLNPRKGGVGGGFDFRASSCPLRNEGKAERVLTKNSNEEIQTNS